MVEIFEKNLSPQQQSMVKWVTLYQSYIFSSAIKPVNSAIIHPTHSLSPSHNSALMLASNYQLLACSPDLLRVHWGLSRYCVILFL